MVLYIIPPDLAAVICDLLKGFPPPLDPSYYCCYSNVWFAIMFPPIIPSALEFLLWRCYCCWLNSALLDALFIGAWLFFIGLEAVSWVICPFGPMFICNTLELPLVFPFVADFFWPFPETFVLWLILLPNWLPDCPDGGFFYYLNCWFYGCCTYIVFILL